MCTNGTTDVDPLAEWLERNKQCEIFENCMVVFRDNAMFRAFSLWLAGWILERDEKTFTVPEIIRVSPRWAFGEFVWGDLVMGKYKYTISRRTLYRYLMKLLALGIVERDMNRAPGAAWRFKDGGLIDYFEDEL